MRVGLVLAQWRWAEHLNIRDAAKQIGVSIATLSRIEHGHPMDGRTLGVIMTWLLQETDT